MSLHVRDRRIRLDRKSTRLNFQSPVPISYAVFCLKKKKKNKKKKKQKTNMTDNRASIDTSDMHTVL